MQKYRVTAIIPMIWRGSRRGKMGTGIGLFLPWEKWDLGHWDWDLVTGNGKNCQKWEWDKYFVTIRHDQSRHHLAGFAKSQKSVQAPCSCQFLTWASIRTFYFPPIDLRSTIFVYSGVCKAKSLQLTTLWRKRRREQSCLARLAMLSWKLSTFLLCCYTHREL